MSDVMSEIELMLFEILYLVMHCDMEAASEEDEFIQNIVKDLDEEQKSMLSKRKENLDNIISQGYESIEEKVKEIADKFNAFPEEYVRDLKNNYLKIIKNLILSDKKIHKNERKLFNTISDKWGGVLSI